MPFPKTISIFAAVGLLAVQGVQAGWLDTALEKVNEVTKESTSSQTGSSALDALTTSEMDGGLKEALDLGVQKAIAQLGTEDGFYGNSLVKIPVPEKLALVESALRKAGMGKYADDFILAMNRAAEKAVPETAKIFADTISDMSITDAKNILTGPDDAATEYFREKSGPALQAAILPIVKEYTAQTEVTTYYKAMMSAYDTYAAPLVEKSGLGTLLGGSEESGTTYDAGDLDGYITAKGVDGLFTVIAEEEKAIRTDPAARTTELLQKVFGSE